MDKQEEIFKFHELAKDAGNKLRAYILSVSSAASGVFFLALTATDTEKLNNLEKWLIGISLFLFVVTVINCLWELRIDAQRFFIAAAENAKEECQQNWCEYDRLKRLRLRLIYSSYVTLGGAVFFTTFYLLLRLVHT